MGQGDPTGAPQSLVQENEMSKFQIENTLSGIVFGEYEGETSAEALDAFARDAGYENFAAACEAAPVEEGEILVTEVE